MLKGTGISDNIKARDEHLEAQTGRLRERGEMENKPEWLDT